MILQQGAVVFGSCNHYHFIMYRASGLPAAMLSTNLNLIKIKLTELDVKPRC